MRSIALFALFATAAFAGCIGDSGTQSGTDENGPTSDDVLLPNNLATLASHPEYGWPTATNYTGFTGDVLPPMWLPPNATEVPETITGLKPIASAPGVGSGAGIAMFGSLAVISGNGPGAVVDIRDPMNPVKIQHISQSTRDADIMAFPDGRLVAVMATGGQIHLLNLTDAHMFTMEDVDYDNNTDYKQMEYIGAIPQASHNAGVVPGTQFVYNSASSGGSLGTGHIGEGSGGSTGIWDLSDPYNPVLVQNFVNGYSCHDIGFFISEDKQRAYCAGIEMTQIWDINNASHPTVISTIPVHHGVSGTPSASVPLVAFSHLAMVNADASILIVGDETGGGAVPPGCDAHAEVAGVSASGPLGNLWFYDITDEENPEYLSHFSPSHPALENPGEGNPASTCTAHFGRLVEDRDLLAMSFYGQGSVLVDFSDPRNPSLAVKDNDGANTWDTWFWQGYLFTGDLSKGMVVFELV